MATVYQKRANLNRFRPDGVQVIFLHGGSQRAEKEGEWGELGKRTHSRGKTGKMGEGILFREDQKDKAEKQ